MTMTSKPVELDPARDPYRITRNPIGLLRATLSGRGVTAPQPPGPIGRPFTGVRREFWADPFEYARELHREYGDVVRLPMPFIDMVLLNHPDLVAQTMNNPDTEYSMAGPASRFVKHLVNATPTMEGPEFQARRRLVMPMFGPSYLSSVAGTMARVFAQRLDRWDRFLDSGRELDLQHEIAKASLHGFVAAMFSYDLPESEAEYLSHAFPQSMQFGSIITFTAPYPRPYLGKDSLLHSLRGIREWVTVRIDERLSDPNPPSDLLQVLVDERDNPAAGFDRKSLISEALVLVAGGFETVVAATSWTLSLLATNPAAQQRLYAEVDRLGGEIPTFDDLKRLRWTKACFDEGQRLQGHPFMPRYAMRDDIVGGYRIRRGTLTGVSFYTLHRDTRWWGPNPDVYDPMRFYDLTQVAQRPNLSFIPFGSGQHRCLGSVMAYMNGQFLLALIHQRYRIHLRPGWQPRHGLTFSVPVKGGVPATLTRAPRPDPDAARAVTDLSDRGGHPPGCPIHVP